MPDDMDMELDMDKEVLRKRRGKGLDIAIIVGDPQVAADLSAAAEASLEGDPGAVDMDPDALPEEAALGDDEGEEKDLDKLASERGLAPGGDEMTQMGESLDEGLGAGLGGLRQGAKAFWKKKPPVK